MFFIFPLGHDRSVYGYPWATITLIALCSVIWFITYSAEQGAMDGINEAGAVVQQVHARYPRARVSWEMHGLPPEITGQLFSELMDPDHTEAVPGDAQLDTAMRGLVAQLNRLPVLRYGYRPAAWSIGTMFSSLFMHGGFFHLFGNMVFLFLTGSVIECFWGRLRFLGLYFASGVLATLAFHAFNTHSYVPLVGASGAVAGLMGAFMVGHPKTKVRFGYIFWFFFVPHAGTFMVPAWGALFAWIVQQLVFALIDLGGGGGGGGVAYWAHVGGFGLGAVAALAMKHFDLFPAYTKELLADEEPQPHPLASMIAAEPLAKRRSAWMAKAAPKLKGERGDLALGNNVAPPRLGHGSVDSIPIPGFEALELGTPHAAGSAFGADESFFDADDDGISIPLAPVDGGEFGGESGLPNDIIPEGAMLAALPEAERYRAANREHSIPMPGFDDLPALPEPTGGFDDQR